MGVHLPKSILDEGPPMIFSASAGAYVGRLFSLDTHGLTTRQEYFSFWPDLLTGIFVLSGIAWWRTSSAREKEDTKKQRAEEETRGKVDEIHNFLFTKSTPELVMAKGNSVAKAVGSSATVPRGASVSSAIGAGDLVVTVPSGISGPGIPETFDIPISEGQTVTLVLGGTVRAVSTVSGHLSILDDSG